MKKFLIIIALVFVTNIASAGWFSDDDLFVGFWKRSSVEAIDNKGSILQSSLARRNPEIGDYIEIEKNNNVYTGTYYAVSSWATEEGVTGYRKMDSIGSIKGDVLSLDFGPGIEEMAPIINSISEGKMIEIVRNIRSSRNGKYALISTFKRVDKNKSLINIVSIGVK